MSGRSLSKALRALKSKSYFPEDTFILSVQYKTATNVLKTFDKRKNKEVEEVISRLEGYPCSMSCYLSQDEWKAAKNMKDSLIRLLKKELSNEN